MVLYPEKVVEFLAIPYWLRWPPLLQGSTRVTFEEGKLILVKVTVAENIHWLIGNLSDLCAEVELLLLTLQVLNNGKEKDPMDHHTPHINKTSQITQMA